MQEYQSIGPACTLGEGPLWHPQRDQLFWFDIPAGELHACNGDGTQHQSWNFGEAASAAGWVDHDTLVVATASGLQKFDITEGSREQLVPMEADNPATRSNDGRIAPDGSFWVGTMAYDMAKEAGAFYRFKDTSLSQLAPNITIPNATCFSPDGKTAYLCDTPQQIIWSWELDANGDPVGERQVHINLREDDLNPDGAVCDAEGYLWNAQWGASRVSRYDPMGNLDQTIDLPVSQPTCPAFGGDDFKTLFVTSAHEGMSPQQRDQEPDAGKVIKIEIDVPGRAEYQAKL